MKPITEPVCKNLPINDKVAVDAYICDGIAAQHEVDYCDDDDENLESLITGRKKYVYTDHSMYDCKFIYTEISDEEDTVFVHVNIFFEQPETIEKIEEEKIGSLEKKGINRDSSVNSVNSNAYSDDVVYAPDNIIFDMVHGATLGYMISLKNYSSMAKSTVRIFKSLLLRTDSKMQALRFAKYLILKRTPLDIMTKIFLKINGVYKDATKERQKKGDDTGNAEAMDIIKTSSSSIGGPANQVLRSMSIAVTNSNRTTLPSNVGSSRLSNFITSKCEDTSRIMTGDVIIFQHEMVQLFVDIIDLNSLPYVYLKAIIIEFIRCLQEFNLPSQPRLQSVTWKFMWVQRDFIGLQNLLQFKVLDDTLELGQHLVQLG